MSDDRAPFFAAAAEGAAPFRFEDMKPMTREELMAALEEGAARLMADSLSPRPPCGFDAAHPHIVAPGGKSGDLRRCVQCGTIGTLP